MRALAVLLAVSTALWLVAWGSFDVKETTPARCDPGCVNGVCNNGTCVCKPGWQGEQCQNCRGRTRLNTTEGTVSDGPINYTSSAKCTWLIEGEGPVRLRLDHFVTECSWDHVYIYDGDGIYGTQLAAFSGSVTTNANRTVEITATTGQAFIYFYSDLAFNMSGFDISYRHNACPLDCSKRGKCENGTCTCSGTGYTGSGCETILGDCQNGGTPFPNGTCSCVGPYNGLHCETFKADAYWQTIDVLGATKPSARSSHAAVAVNNSIWVFGGMRFTGQPVSDDDIARYDVDSANWTIIDAVGPKPTSRYDHSVVYYKGKFYVFGGVVTERNITNELWSFDPSTNQWTLEMAGNNSVNFIPFAVAGHTAHVIDDVMYVVFGYNIFRGYMYQVQEYSFGNKKWSVPNTGGTQVIGTFGHSSVVIYKNNQSLILVHGGYYAPDTTASYAISDRLYEYNPAQKTWRTLASSGSQLFRHAAAVINDILVVVGGNAHNESTANRLTDCYSAKTMAYDIECESWFELNVGSSLVYVYPSLDRYGHSVTFVDDRLFVFGGFNGQMLNDVVMFTPGDCKGYDLSQTDCQSANQGVKCEYDKDSPSGQLCHRKGTPSFASVLRGLTKNIAAEQSANACPGPTQQQTCSERVSCTACLSDSGCVWCGDSCQTTCGARSLDITDVSLCTDQKSRECNMIFECVACQEQPFCRWHVTDTRVGCITIKEEEILIKEQKQSGQRGADDQAADHESSPIHTTLSMATNVLSLSNGTCPAPCAVNTDCKSCTDENCMWCSTTKRCINMNAYMVSFPYGQCSAWVSRSNSNTDACTFDPSDCEVQQTCADCQEVGPGCGWCDDGSGTGLGKCVAGSLSGPYSANSSITPAQICTKTSWFFVGCPACQCNGHSSCVTNRTAKLAKMSLARKTEHQVISGSDGAQCRQPCGNHTTGDNCEVCRDGYFGNALNGGNCTTCQCNGQATNCDPHSGECYCTTKGVSGQHCDKCEQKYYGDPKNNTCYYELAIDFIFTFNLDDSEPKDKYVNRINFFSRPYKKDTDVSFAILCEGGTAKVNLSMISNTFTPYKNMEKRLLINQICDKTSIRRTYSAGEYEFGTDSNTTFLVYVYDFKTPIKIQISFAQSPPINWVLFFVIFAACFIVLLVVAGLLWMIKLRIDVYRRRQRMFVEIEQMASRPFGTVRLELTKTSHPTNKFASPISVEPCANYKAAVVTVAVRLPTGGRKFTPSGTSGLAVASSLCLLTPGQVSVLQAPPSPDPNEKRKHRLRRLWFCRR